MALSAPVFYSTRSGDDIRSHRITNAVKVFNGALVGLTTATGLLSLWSDPSGGTVIFLGIAEVTDSEGGAGSITGNTSASDPPEAKVNCSGVVICNATVAGLDNIDDTGKLVYASDDGTFTLTATGGGNEIGTVVRYAGVSGKGDIKLYSADAFRANRGS